MHINHKSIEEQKKIKVEPIFIVSEPKYRFEDIILNKTIKEDIEDTMAIERYKYLIYDTWQLASVIKKHKGLSLNIFGPSGTGKTMIAHAIANELGLKIIEVNYAEIESKYVGETSKNLVKMFQFAKDNGVLLLFDEADALLSKRVTSMNNATDISVNQTRNVLLKLLDSYEEPVVFTTNFISNYDNAFYRRITHHIEIPYPDEEQRKLLWRHYLLDTLPISGEKEQIITEVSLIDRVTGADIANTVLSVALKVARGSIDKIDSSVIIEKLKSIKKIKDDVDFDDSVMITRKKISKEEADNILSKGGIV